MLKYLYLSLMLLFCAPASALTPQGESEETDTASTIKFADRISIHTNTLGWLFMTPNVGVEYDFVHNKHKKISLLLTGKFNGQTNQKFASRYVYNVAGARAELRWYFRTRKIDDLGDKPEERIYSGKAADFRGPWEKERVSSTDGFFNKLWNSRGLVTAKKNPRRHRAYYVGPYAAYDKFSVKFTETGYQGSAIGAGVSFGYSAPLYIYNNGNVIDFEIGAGVGAAIIDYDEYGYSREDNCYTAGNTGKSAILPMLSDVRLSLVYRFEPIQDQAYEVNYDKLVKQRHMYNLRKEYLVKDTAFVMSDSVIDLIKEYNKKIFAYNSKIKEYNREILKHENADSADLLTEQAPAFEYIRVPKKLLNFGSDKMLENKEIVSVDELNDKYISNIIEQFKPIANIVENYETRAASADAIMLGNYQSVSMRIDSLSGIPYYDYILGVIPRINAEVIKPHNESILMAVADNSQVNDTLAARHFLDSANNVGSGSLIKLTDKFVLKAPKNYALLSLNDQIASENLNKVDLLQQKYGITADLGQIDHEKIERERKAAKEKAKAAEEKAKQDAKAAKEKAKQDAKAAKEKAKQDAKAAKEKAKQEAEAAKEQPKQEAETAADGATATVAGQAEAVSEKVEEAAAEVEEAVEATESAIDENKTKEQAKAEEKARKEQEKLDKELKKQQEKAAKEQAKAEEKARKEQEKLDKELKKQQEKAAKEQAKAEEKARKEQEKLEKKQSKESDADNNKNENSDEE